MKDKIYVVGYGAFAHLVTTNKKDAEEFCKDKLEGPGIEDWKVRTIDEALVEAWRGGYNQAKIDYQLWDWS